MRRRCPFATTARTKGNLACNNFANIWLSDVQRNSFVGNNRRMSTTSRTIRPNVRTVYTKVL